MLSSVEQHYLDLLFEQAALQWENYACGAAHDLSRIDKQLYDLILANPQPREFSGRKSEIWHKIVTRGLVDQHPAVSELCQRLDNWDNYRQQNVANLPANEARLLLASRMRPDVLKLIELRNQLARQYGFSSYAELAFNCEDLDAGTVLQTVQSYLDSNLKAARALIQKYRLTWESWFQTIDTLGSTKLKFEPQAVLKDLLTRLDLYDLHAYIRLVVKQEGLAGYAGCLSVPNDVRILLRYCPSLNGLRILFHELGHAVYHAANEEQGLFVTWSYTEDEIMAVVVEWIGAEIMLTKEQAQIACHVALLENVRCAISTLFEYELWHQPQAAERLYLKYYSKLGMPITDPVVWALDSFRSIDPIYIHSYVLGAQMAEQTRAYLRKQYGNRYCEWGEWVRHNYFAPGRRLPLRQKLNPVLTQS